MERIEVLQNICANSFRYYSSVLSSTISSDQYIYNHLKFIETFDRVMGFKNIPCKNVILVIAYITVFVIRLLSFVLVLKYFPFLRHDFYNFHMVNYLFMGGDCCYLLRTLICNYFCIRIRLLLRWLAAQVSSPNINSQFKIYAYKKFLSAYRHLLDNMESSNTSRKVNLLCTLPTELIRMLIHLKKYFGWGQRLEEGSLEETQKYYARYILIFESVSVFTGSQTPCLLLELVAYEFEKIQTILAEELMFTSEKEEREALLEVMEYMDQRPANWWFNGTADYLRCFLLNKLTLGVSTPVEFGHSGAYRVKIKAFDV